ncbi:MAG: 7-cyano-7-deazaguanine synthase QueC [Candidatus Heimdallarchaeota archaeon]|nr:7-cyano-7-deazaguanine synthase QueC [Candidatus Heimdallarchaeota archaeon]
MLWFFTQNDYVVKEVISFNYAQKHMIETEHAKEIMLKYQDQFGIKPNHLIVDIDNIGEILSAGALTGNDELPLDLYDVDSQKITVVPNRNMILLSIAAGRAVSIKANKIGYAAHASDYSVYPDCRPEFISAMDKALLLGNLWDPVGLEAPFKHLSKAEIVKLALEMNVPLELTWSCYKGNNRPCLQCGTCLERTHAFLKNDVQDPALNDEEWSKALDYLNKKLAQRNLITKTEN